MQYNKKSFYFSVFLVTLITIIGAWLRFYQFRDYLFFEIDQARDWKIVYDAIKNGVGDLPLLGARAGGTFFRLGPFFNYLQYLSALIFGFTPETLAYPVVFFSILTIPLFYYFLREYFHQIIAVFLTLVFAISLFVLEYSRFAWNPNLVPFFFLLFIFSLLKSSYNQQKRTLWLVLAMVSLGILMQLHTLTMVTSPLIFVIFTLWAKIKFSIKEGLVMFSIFVMLNAPFVLNDIFNGFANTRAFFDGIISKNKTQNEFSFKKKFFKGSQEMVKNYSLILTSHEIILSLDQGRRSGGLLALIKRNIETKEEVFNLIFSLVGFGGIIGAFVFFIRDFLNTGKKNLKKRNFLKLLFLWQGIFLVLFVALAVKPDTRYYLPVIFIPFVILGFWINFLFFVPKIRWLGFFLLVFLLIMLNGRGVYGWLQLQESYFPLQKKDWLCELIFKEEFILEPYFRVNLREFWAVVDFLEKEYSKESTKVTFEAPVYYERSLEYLLSYERKIPIEKGILEEELSEDKRYYIIKEKEKKIRSCNSRIIVLNSELSSVFVIKESFCFGNLVVARLELKIGSDGVLLFNQKNKNNHQKKELGDKDLMPKKYQWKELIKKPKF